MDTLIEIIKSFKDSCLEEIRIRQNKQKVKKIEEITEKRNQLFKEYTTIKMKISSNTELNMSVDEYLQLCKRLAEIQHEESYCREYLESFCKLYVIGSKEYNEYVEKIKKNNTCL